MDQKNQAELTDLMNKMFEERAKALRLFMLELMKQKNAEIELIKQEIEP